MLLPCLSVSNREEEKEEEILPRDSEVEIAPPFPLHGWIKRAAHFAETFFFQVIDGHGGIETVSYIFFFFCIFWEQIFIREKICCFVREEQLMRVWGLSTMMLLPLLSREIILLASSLVVRIDLPVIRTLLFKIVSFSFEEKKIIDFYPFASKGFCSSCFADPKKLKSCLGN